MDSPPSPTPAGWFPDPLDRHQHRYFNGRTWTSDVADDGVRFVDPLGSAPGAPTGTGRGNRIATAAMVCGILSVLSAWIPFIVVVGFVLAVLAVIMGIIGMGRARTTGSGRGFARTGVATGAVGIVLAILGTWLTVIVWREVEAFIEPGRVTVEVVECLSTDTELRVTGQLTNSSSTSRGYTVFVTARSERSPGSTRDSVRVIDDVAPGDTVGWVVSTEPFGTPGACSADVDVQGPFPFDIEIDAISD